MKKAAIILLFGMFLAFLGYEAFRESEYVVLDVISPSEIVVDLNKNGEKDTDELVVLKGFESFLLENGDENNNLAKKMKMSIDDSVAMGVLAQDFAKTSLLERDVKLVLNKRPKNEWRLPWLRISSVDVSDITFENKSYSKQIVEEGYAVRKDGFISDNFKKNLSNVQKMQFVVFNEKSGKYHKLSCKYAKLAHNTDIIPVLHLPKGSKPCKFCMVKHNNSFGKKRSARRDFLSFSDFIPDVKQPALKFSQGGIKVFILDYTRKLKPDNLCSTDFCKELKSQIDSAQSTIDFALYGYTKNKDIEKALINAQKRGVRIRFVYDLDKSGRNIYPDTEYLAGMFTQHRADATQAIMHDKFFVFDNRRVITGSANMSNTDLSGYNSNFVVLIDSDEIARIYSAEFEQMYGGLFQGRKSRIVGNKDIKLGNFNISVYFSPQDKIISEKIIPLVQNAKKYIYMPVFLITNRKLANALIDSASRGVAVKIVVDATNARGNHSVHQLLRQNGIQVKTENFAGKLHSKSMIIDDEISVIGSMNFSKSGERANDENVLIIKNRDFALFNKAYFQYLWKRIPDKWLKLNARSESFDSIGSCIDGVDNDFDGKIDSLDDGCKMFLKQATMRN